VVVEDETNGKELVTKLIDILNKEFGIDHTTIQIEDESYPKAAHEH
jgi:Co/Zn/Cd efflux system component